MSRVDCKEWLAKFQSSAAPKNGCYMRLAAWNMDFIDVSILSRSEERLLLSSNLDTVASFRFQSSAAPKNGCYVGGLCDLIKGDRFQSSAAPKNGCYHLDRGGNEQGLGVSILSRSEERLLPAGRPDEPGTGGDVSILSRSEERLLPAAYAALVRSSV